MQNLHNLNYHNSSSSSSVVSGLFDEDPGIMSEADTSSTSGRKRRQLKAEAQKYHHPQMTGSVILLEQHINGVLEFSNGIQEKLGI